MTESDDVRATHAEWELPEVGVAVIVLAFVVVIAASALAGLIAGVGSGPWRQTVGLALQDATEWSLPFFIFPVVFAVGLVWWQVHTWIGVIDAAAAGQRSGRGRTAALTRLRRQRIRRADGPDDELLAAFDHLLRARTLATWTVPVLGTALVAAVGSVLGEFLATAGLAGSAAWGARGPDHRLGGRHRDPRRQRRGGGRLPAPPRRRGIRAGRAGRRARSRARPRRRRRRCRGCAIGLRSPATPRRSPCAPGSPTCSGSSFPSWPSATAATWWRPSPTPGASACSGRWRTRPSSSRWTCAGSRSRPGAAATASTCSYPSSYAGAEEGGLDARRRAPAAPRRPAGVRRRHPAPLRACPPLPEDAAGGHRSATCSPTWPRRATSPCSTWPSPTTSRLVASALGPPAARAHHPGP